MDSAETAGIIIVTMALVKLVENVVARIQADKGGNGKGGLTVEQSKQLSSLYQWHDRVDSDGVPLWYLPRSFVQHQQQIVDTMRQVVVTQERLTELLSRLEARLEKMG